MSFHHLAGVTAPAAPDEIVDWFTDFETWITATVGWTIASGAGTTNLYITSAGEAGGLTMLYIHVYRVGVGNTIRIEVSDDAIPTHETAEAGTLDSGGVQFAWWMTADKDAIVICWKAGAGYRAIYAGLVMPFALTVPDETYHSIVTNSRLDQGSILRDFNNVWDVDHGLWQTGYLSEVDSLDGSLPLVGRFFNDDQEIAGQLKHISGRIPAGGVNPEDTVATGLPGATTTWIVLADSANNKFAMRTGGVLPTGQPDGAHFAHVSGVAANQGALIAAVTTFLTGVGWTDEGSPGIQPGDRLWSSTGESGAELIYVYLYWQVPGSLYISVWSDLVGTQQTAPPSFQSCPAGSFPLSYWLSGDRDCVIILWQVGVNFYALWAGRTMPFAPSLYPPYVGPPLSEYAVISSAGIGSTSRVLRGHDGVWNTSVRIHYDDARATPSSPNSFDGTTYIVWPVFACDQTPILLYEGVGQMKYLFYANGGGIASMDTITVGAQVYTVFWYPVVGVFMCIRTV